MLLPAYTAQREAAPSEALAVSWGTLGTEPEKSMTRLQCQLLYQGPEAMWMKKIPRHI